MCSYLLYNHKNQRELLEQNIKVLWFKRHLLESEGEVLSFPFLQPVGQDTVLPPNYIFNNLTQATEREWWGGQCGAGGDGEESVTAGASDEETTALGDGGRPEQEVQAKE